MKPNAVKRRRTRIKRFAKKVSHKAGSSPGTILHIGDKKKDDVSIDLINYDAEQVQETVIGSVAEVSAFKRAPSVTWVNVEGLHDTAVIESVGTQFDIHPLTLEDIVNTGQHPKLEHFETYLCIIFKMLQYNESEHLVSSEQVSLIFGRDFLVSFQEATGDVFEPVRDRIRKGKGRIRSRGSDYLAYALMDAVVDNYFVILEKLSERIESLEQEMVANPQTDTLHVIHDLKRETIYLRKQIWPLREMVTRLAKGDTDLVHETTFAYLRDIHDHTIQITETVDSFRDILSGLTELYLSTTSNRLNEVMKVLTMIATIFIPITFIAGIYGMNFKHMPELEWKWGYPAAWGIMIGIVLSLLVYFKKKRWL